MNTSTQVNSKSTCQEYDERQKRTLKKILEVLDISERKNVVVRVHWNRITLIREGSGWSLSCGTLGQSGLISVEDAKIVASMISGKGPDPKAMRILTEYLEEEWATFRLADVNREVAKYDAANPNGAYIPRCQSCGHQSNTTVCVPCRKALARTLANIDVALALFVKEEVSFFRAGHEGLSIAVNDATRPLVFRMFQSGGYLTREHVRDLCERATIVPYDDNGQSAAGMMQDHLNSGTRKAEAAREAARKDMMSGVQGAAVATVKGGASGGGGGYVDESEVFRGPEGEVYYSGDPKPMEKHSGLDAKTAEVIEKIMDADMGRILRLGAKIAEEQKPSGFDAKTEEAIREAAEGKWCLSVQSHPHVFWNGSSSDQEAPLLSTAFLVQGEASWPHCIDKDGNVSGDLLDTLYEFYERLREKCAADERPYPNVPRKNFFAMLVRGNPEVVAIGVQDDRGRHALTAIPWDKPTKSSILAKLGEELREAGDLGKSLSNVYATMLSIFQDMFAPKDDSALWGSSCG